MFCSCLASLEWYKAAGTHWWIQLDMLSSLLPVLVTASGVWMAPAWAAWVMFGNGRVGLLAWKPERHQKAEKAFSDARLPYSNLSYVQCFSASQSPFLGTPFLGTIFFWDGVFFNKRRKPPSLVPLPSFHGFNGLKWLIQHHCGHQSLPKCFLVLLWHFPDLKS